MKDDLFFPFVMLVTFLHTADNPIVRCTFIITQECALSYTPRIQLS